MQKYMKDLQNSLGFQEKGKDTIYGICNGYEVTIFGNTNTFVFINFYADTMKKNEIANFFKQNATKNLTQIQLIEYGFMASISGMTYGSIAKAIVNAVQSTTKLLQEQEIPGLGTCPLCGEPTEDNQPSMVNNLWVTLCPKCEEQVKTYVEEKEKQYQAQPNNYFKGTVGAVIGAAVCGLSWIILYLIGVLSAISGVLAVFLGNYLYEKFGGKSNKTKLVIVGFCSLITLVLTCLLMYIFVGNGLAYSESLNPELTGLQYILNDAELTAYFIEDMLYTSVFTIVGVVAVVINIYKKNENSRSKFSK